MWGNKKVDGEMWEMMMQGTGLGIAGTVSLSWRETEGDRVES